MKKQLTFYFIRHGKTVWNTEGLMQGHGDSPLTEEGINGAKKTGVALNHIPFIAAYSSVLNRTIATASHIIGERDIPLFHHQGLNEQYFGSWEGKVVETFEQLGERAMKALQDIIKIHDYGNILIVSHGHTLRLLLALLNGATWQNHRDEDKSVSLINTSISVVHYNDENGFCVEKMNDADHLK